jgi:hypothetical protein
MTWDERRQTLVCPRCDEAVEQAHRFCPNCGLRLPNGGGRRIPGKSGSPFEILVWLAPGIGGLLGFVIGEAIVGQLVADVAILVPIGVLVVVGVFIGGPVAGWLIDRLGP